MGPVSYGYIDANVTHAVDYGLVSHGTTVATCPAQSGTDASSNRTAYPDGLTGATNDDPDWNQPFWNTFVYPVNDVSYANLPWSSPATSVPPNKQSCIVTYWEYQLGWQAFAYQVNGVNTGPTSRRDLDRWSPIDYKTVISDAPRGGGGMD